MSLSLTLFLILLFLIGEGFFSGSEIALVSANQLQLKVRAEEGHRGSSLALQLLQRPEFLLGTCLMGTNLCTVGASTVATIQFAHTFANNGEIGVALSLFPFILLFGELIPKSVYREHADFLVTRIVFPLRVFSILFTPILLTLEAITTRLFRVLKLDNAPEDTPSREDLQRLLDESETVVIDEDERERIQRVFAFGESTVEDVMVPLIEVVMVAENDTVSDAITAIVEHGHSWLPVYEGRVDHVIGVLHHSDLLRLEDTECAVHSVMRPVSFVPETKPVEGLFREFRTNRRRLAIAVDEYGGAVGLVTSEDLLEEIVGEIDDEHDSRIRKVRKVGPQTWLVNARIEEEVLEDATGFLLPEGDYETLAGFVLMRLGHIPQVGERLAEGDWWIEVTRATERAILEMKLIEPPPEKK
ncbi:MAG: hemolysin family protein [Myxococcota bacterium]|nr:hemolysin family protein [Myxococcota bacterium]